MSATYPTIAERDNESLVQLMLECYTRSFMYPNNEDVHNCWVECRVEVLRRLQTAGAELREVRDRIAALPVEKE